jgi:cellulose synthase operon protein YhjQ
MGSVSAEAEREQLAGTPEDVAALYSWANVQGAKYRDFSGSRREYRAQVRHRAAQELRERELKAQAAAEAAAVEAERESKAFEAEFQDLSQGENLPETQTERMQALRDAGTAAQKASAQRAEARRHGENAAQLAVAVLREQREIADARESAERQARNYAGTDLSQPSPGAAHTLAAATEDPNAESFFALDLSRNAASLRSARGPEADEASAAGTAGLAEPETAQLGPAWLYATHPAPSAPAIQTAPPPRETQTPLLAIFSFEGGVGKTGLVATLSRALGAQGERVVLADTTSHGLLPFYFGARELQSGVRRTFPIARTFPAASGATAQPLSLVSYDVAEGSDSQPQREALVEEILHNCEDSDRLVLDISSGSNWLVRRIAGRHPVVLVPMALDLNSVITMQAVERLFYVIPDCDGQPIQPYYVLNQFDESVPLHIEVRESLTRQLGDRLLPIVIRRSSAVNEALAEGMTVIDFAPDAPVSQDYLEVAAWLRGVSPCAPAEPVPETVTAPGSAP